MKQTRITPLIILLVLSLLVGFSLLSLVYEGSLVVKVIVGGVVMVMSVFLVIVSIRFDRSLAKEVHSDEKQAEK